MEEMGGTKSLEEEGQSLRETDQDPAVGIETGVEAETDQLPLIILELVFHQLWKNLLRWWQFPGMILRILQEIETKTLLNLDFSMTNIVLYTEVTEPGLRR